MSWKGTIVTQSKAMCVPGLSSLFKNHSFSVTIWCDWWFSSSSGTFSLMLFTSKVSTLNIFGFTLIYLQFFLFYIWTTIPFPPLLLPTPQPPANPELQRGQFLLTYRERAYSGYQAEASPFPHIKNRIHKTSLCIKEKFCFYCQGLTKYARHSNVLHIQRAKFRPMNILQKEISSWS